MFLKFSTLFLLFYMVTCQADLPYVVQKSDKYLYGVDLDGPYSQKLFNCLNQHGYDIAFIRVYAPFYGGEVDLSGIDALEQADSLNWNYNYSKGIEIYATPCPHNGKSAKQQVHEIMKTYKHHRWTLYHIWLQVTMPQYWSNDTQENIKFIKDFVEYAESHKVEPREKYEPNHVLVGIYTSKEEWQAITGGWKDLSNNSLWYWNVYGAGLAGESPQNLYDFQEFGDWKPDLISVKQFAQLEAVCGVVLNRAIIPIMEEPKTKKKSKTRSEIISEKPGKRIHIGHGVLKN